MDADILGCGQESGSIWFWENLDGLGGTWSGQELVEVPWADDLSFVKVADFNGDGQADLAVSYLYGGCVLISGDWPWDWYVVPLEESAILGILLPCDVDGDRDQDITAARYWGGGVAWYENDLQGLGEWPVHPMTGIGWMSWPEVSMGDYDNYCQYRVHLSTPDSSVTPVLQEVCLSYDPLGIPGEGTGLHHGGPAGG